MFVVVGVELLLGVGVIIVFVLCVVLMVDLIVMCDCVGVCIIVFGGVDIWLFSCFGLLVFFFFDVVGWQVVEVLVVDLELMIEGFVVWVLCCVIVVWGFQGVFGCFIVVIQFVVELSRCGCSVGFVDVDIVVLFFVLFFGFSDDVFGMVVVCCWVECGVFDVVELIRFVIWIGVGVGECEVFFGINWLS